MSHAQVKSRVFLQWAGLLLCVAAYEIVSILIDKPAFPDVTRILRGLISFIGDRKFVWPSFGYTVARWFIAWILCGMTAVVLGAILGYFADAYRLASGVLDFLRSLPATLLATFSTAAFGIGEISMLFPTAYVVFFTVIFYVAKHGQFVDKTRIQHLRRLHAPFRFILTHAILPDYASGIMTALQQSLSLSFLIQVSSELILGSAGNRGIGNVLYDFKDYSHFDALLASILILGIVGYAANIAFRVLQERLFPWLELPLQPIRSQ